MMREKLCSAAKNMVEYSNNIARESGAMFKEYIGNIGSEVVKNNIEEPE